MELNHFKPGKMTINDAILQFSKMGFNARKLSQAIDIWESMIQDKECMRMMSFSGALVPGGLRDCIIEVIENGWVDVVCTTGANLTHDLSEALGVKHIQGTEKASDEQLRKEGLNRIYDIYMPNKAYEEMEDKLQPIFKELSGKRYKIKEFLHDLGGRIEERSILKSCHDNDVDLYCPAISDSGIGLQMWYFLHENDINVDAFLDLKDIISRCWDSKRTGVAIIGGGVPKNFILQAIQATDKEHSYAFQIMTDRPEYGGLSGAPLREGVSWGKIHDGPSTVDVVSDATIALPLMVSALKERI